MADTVRRSDYYYVTVADEPGAAVRILDALREEGVNLRAFHAFPEAGKSQLDFVPADTPKFEAAAKKAGLNLSAKKTVFWIAGDDRPGATADALTRLADAGINVTAMTAVAGTAGRYAALLWVSPGDVDRAAEALGAA